MFEAVAAASIAVIGGGYSIIQALHRRVTLVDSRLDRIELGLARDYVTRQEFYKEHGKLEEHMIRIEEKLDRMLERQQRFPS